MVNVIGLGYIGLPTALMMAAHGETVAGTDRNADLVARLNAGQVTFREEGLEELFSQAQAAGITFSAAYQRADFYVISVPTPYEKVSRKMDAGAVLAAVRQGRCNYHRIHGFPGNHPPVHLSHCGGGGIHAGGGYFPGSCAGTHYSGQYAGRA